MSLDNRLENEVNVTRQPHDQFAKEYLEELLTLLGTVETSKDVKSEVQEIDVWFVPSPSLPSDVPDLGLLAKMAAMPCLFEPFRNAPNENQIRSCLLKLYSVQGDLLRKAKREKQSLPALELPFLWIISPSCSQRILEGFAGELKVSEGWFEGVYFFPEFYKTALIAINQLPVIEDTLWLRVLGKGRTQKQAVEDLVSLSETTPRWNNLVDVLANWRKNLELRDNVNDEYRELIMNLSPAYLKQRQEWFEEGRQEVNQMIISFLEVRFGTLDPELSNLVESIGALPIPERVQLLLSLGSISREELLERFR